MVTFDYSNALKEARVHPNLRDWHIQRDKLLEFIYRLVDRGFEYSEVLDRAQSWSEEQTINFLPFYVHEEVNLVWRRSVEKKHPVVKRGK